MKNLKHIKLFENFGLNEGARERAEGALEDLVLKMWPNQVYKTEGRGEPGEYELDSDTSADGSKIVFANVYLTPEEVDGIDNQLDNDYEKYEEELNKNLDPTYSVEDIGTAPMDNMISISINYEPSFRR